MTLTGRTLTPLSHQGFPRCRVVTSINSLTNKEVQDADIVVVASNLFHSSVYLANLEALAGAGSLPLQDGRYFNARLETSYFKWRFFFLGEPRVSLEVVLSTLKSYKPHRF